MESRAYDLNFNTVMTQVSQLKAKKKQKVFKREKRTLAEKNKKSNDEKIEITFLTREKKGL